MVKSLSLDVSGYSFGVYLASTKFSTYKFAKINERSGNCRSVSPPAYINKTRGGIFN